MPRKSKKIEEPPTEENVGNLKVECDTLMMYNNKKMRYSTWTSMVMEDSDEEKLLTLAEMAKDIHVDKNGVRSSSSFDYSTEVFEFEEKEDGNYRILMRVDGTLYPWYGIWNVILSPTGKVLEKTSVDK